MAEKDVKVNKDNTEEQAAESSEDKRAEEAVDAQEREGVRKEQGKTDEAPNDESNETESSETESSEEDEVAQLEKKIEELENENSELKNQFLRKQADLENTRKRLMREKNESVKYGNAELLKDIANIIDDFERAIKSSEQSRDFDTFYEGIKLIEKQFVNMLERKWGVERFDSEGDEFDPQKHEAVMMEPSDRHDDTVVLEDFQKGYMLHDRVLRPAKVKVSQPVASGESETTSEETDDNKSNE